MPLRLILIIYNVLLPVVLLIGFPSFIIKGIKRGGLARNFRQRFGNYRPEDIEKLGRDGNFWIHAVSVGEVLVAEKIISALYEREPNRNVVLSTTTTTGFRIADEKYADSNHVTVIHNPVDLPLVTRRAIKLIRPEKLILVEAEVWPNLVRQLQKREVRIYLVNARLSPRSERRYLKFSTMIRPVFGMVSRVCIPFEGDFSRWASLGIDRANISLTGSVKFDEDQATDRPDAKIAELKNWLTENGVADDQPILLGGSTHAGEELLLASVWQNLRKTTPNLALVIVPRHAERAREIAAELAEAGIETVLKNGGSSRLNPFELATQPCLVANTTGELRVWFFLADAVVIGKSLTGKGGQNPVEPVMAGRPTIVGPNMQNFAGVMQDLVAAKGIVQLPTSEPELLETAITNVLSGPDKAAEMAKRGQAAMESHRGAATRTVDVILS